MMHRFIFWRMLNGHFLTGLLGLLVVVGIVLLIVFLASRKNKVPAQAAGTAAGSAVHATHERILGMLSELKNAGSMSTAEYEERRLVLEGGKGDNYANAELVALKERYARAELTTGAYVEARSALLGGN
ncbi:MAG: hypothetical protein LLF75_00090 [Eubacteriales bacterium]|nr:hypothetical protein [Eubacteriales bacterium]